MTDKEMFLSMSTEEIGGYAYPPVGDRGLNVAARHPGLRPEESNLPSASIRSTLPPPSARSGDRTSRVSPAQAMTSTGC